MKAKLVFEDWKDGQESVYSSPGGVELSLGDFHSGSTFSIEIDLDAEQEAEVKNAMRGGFSPVFRLAPDYDNECFNCLGCDGCSSPHEQRDEPCAHCGGSPEDHGYKWGGPCKKLNCPGYTDDGEHPED